MSVLGLQIATVAAGDVLGTLALALAVATWLVSKTPRRRAAAAVLTLGLAPLVLIATITGDRETSFAPLTAPVIAAAAVAAALAVLAVAALFTRFPNVVMPAVLLALPFRVPLAVDGDSVKLLLPLYLVIAGAVAAYALAAWRSDSPAPEPRSPRLLDVALAFFLLLYAAQAAYSADASVAAQNMAFFYAPFALLYGVAATERWDSWTLRACAAALVGVALLLAAAGFFEFARGSYLLTPGGIKPNDFDPYFRVQSLFFDPNIFGRFVAVAMLTIAALLVYTKRPVRVFGCALLLSVLWAGLVMTLSQSSFIALLAGLVALAALRWNARVVIAASSAALVAGLVLVLAFPSAAGVDLTSERAAETTTSGRFDLVKGGVRLFADRPLWGYGSGGFSEAFERKRLGADSRFGSSTTTKSHTAPLTVAAEQGLVGLTAFLLLLITGFGAVFRRAGEGRAGADGARDRPGHVARMAVAAAFTALFVHSLTYAALLEDPLTWVMLGAAVSLAAIPRNGTAASAESYS